MTAAERIARIAMGHLGLDESRLRILPRAVAEAVGLMGVADEAALADRLEADDPAALRALVTAFTVGESYFFRHSEHFERLRALAAGRSEVKVWSAACSSGQETYSAVITLLEAGVGSMDVLGTDVSEDALERARGAVYREWAFREVPEEVRARWFEPEGRTWRVIDRARSRARFAHGNLLVGEVPSGCDVIFCRNVLIYLQPSAVRTVADRLRGALAPGGAVHLAGGPVACALRAES